MRYISGYRNSSHSAIYPVERQVVLDEWFMHSVN